MAKTAVKKPPVKKAAAKKETVKKTPVANTVPCRDGCGEIPKKRGSEFLPGHDARLRGRLLKFRRAEAKAAKKDAKPEDKAKAKEALALLKGVDVDWAESWLASAHNQ